MSITRIKAENLGKQYKRGVSQWGKYSRLTDVFYNLVSFGRKAEKESLSTFWALNDANFEVTEGETFGVIGRNGSGKSTLLKIISRITPPSTGRCKLKGRVGSLLEVGTGFHPELTGRENIFLNGAIMGMKKQEITRQFDAIVDFSQIEGFIDTPVKHYSSGMYLRLAFAIAAHLDQEILLIDELLAVGDMNFQQRCVSKIGSVAASGRTVLFVSHNMGVISELCNRVLVLSHGKTVMVADTREGIAAYLSSCGDNSEFAGRTAEECAHLDMYIESIKIVGAQTHGNSLSFAVQDPYTVEITTVCNKPIKEVELSLVVLNALGTPVLMTSWSDFHNNLLNPSVGKQTFRVEFPGNFLAPDTYFLSGWLHHPKIMFIDRYDEALKFDILETGSYLMRYPNCRYGNVLVGFPWSMQKEAGQS